MDILYANQTVMLKEAKQVMKKVISEDPMESLYMVDLIQRLGIEHHFQEDIEAALEKQHFIVSTDPIDFFQSHQLDNVALSFRLLRQGGYSLNADIFERLKKNKVQLREAYGEDVKSLIAVHEAAQLSIGEEDISLEDSGRLCRELLHSWLQSRHHHHHEAQYVAISLQQPLHHNLPRFMDKTILLRNFKPDKESVCFMELAEINSSIVRLMNQHEALQVSKWWKGEAMSKEPTFGGYEALKWYMWPMACFTDPSFSEQRIELTKCISLWIRLSNAFLEERHWLNSGELPKTEEYLKHAVVSTGVHVVLVHAFFLLHQNITHKSLAIFDDFPNIIYSVAKILRLSDDLEGYKNKNETGFDGSYIECYMREHQEVSAEDAQKHVEELISMEWKRLNRQVVLSTDHQFSSSYTKFCLNAARMVPLMYHYRTNPSLSNLHQYVKSIAKCQ
ncbi:hypothetical protein Ahy_B10g100880 isoform B [Arachis hypogaea]|uniref:Terpene synthase N-terminal domain-containing protein n=1 Tax=Arachis hypogaea TaxID=3818 RepID=A0A444WXU8_ARAHY|nr:hypothetical protein Ahy_B10g100880 isoform B [Arachis hypogaea]